MSKPTEIAITLAALGCSNEGNGWVYADSVRDRLRLLGFECTTHQVAAWLARMARTDAPWVERDRCGPWMYKVTSFGRVDIHNRLPGIGTPLSPDRAYMTSSEQAL